MKTIEEIICLIFGHDTRPTNYSYWEITKMNFVCMRCNKDFRKF